MSLLEYNERLESRIINVILLGKSGSGKSSTGNTILQRQEFGSSENRHNSRMYCQLECCEIDGVLLRVVDTPALNVSSKINRRVRTALRMLRGGKFVFVYVMPFGDRFTQEESQTLATVKDLIGFKSFNDGCVVAMTKGDLFDLNNEDTNRSYLFTEWLRSQTGPPGFVELVNDCQKRVVLFYNKGEIFRAKKERSRHELLEMIHSLPVLSTSEISKPFPEKIIAYFAKFQHHILQSSLHEKLSLIKQIIFQILAINDTTAKPFGGQIQKINGIFESLLGELGKCPNLRRSLEEISMRVIGVKLSNKTAHHERDQLKENLMSLYQRVVSVKSDWTLNSEVRNAELKDKMKVLGAAGGLVGGTFGCAAGTAAGVTAVGNISATVLLGPTAIVAVAGVGVGCAVAYFSVDEICFL